jgi:hypothetical protein
MRKFRLSLWIGVLWFGAGLLVAQPPEESTKPKEDSAPQNAGETPQNPSRTQQLMVRLQEADESGVPVQFREGAQFEFWPYAGTIRAGSGPAIGGTVNAMGLTPLRLDLSGTARISTRAYQWHRLQIGRLQDRRRTFQLDPVGSRFYREFNEWGPKSRGMVIYADANFRSFRREEYFGPGPGSIEDQRTNYHFRGSSFELVTGVQFNRWLGLSLRGGFVDPDLSRGRDPNFPDSGEFFEDLPGMDRQPGFYRVSSALLLDYRDEPGNPHRGGIMGLYYSRFDDRGGSDFAFNRYGVDLRQYLPLFSDRNVLALRAVSLADEPIGNGAVPFYFQESLGGSSCLRGFRDYRFRDNKLMCMNAEFRRELGNVVELAAFYDAGKVFPDWSAFTFRQLERGYGGGFRLKTTRFVLFRLDIGRSREGTRYHFKLGRSF